MTLGYIDIFYVSLGIISLSNKPAGCNPITNSNFNDHIREFALKDDDFNSSNAKTLLKEEPGRYANFTPIPSYVKFKDSQDSSPSGSSYSRGLVHHEHINHPIHDHEGPHYEHGVELHFPEYHHGYPYGIDHHGIDDGHSYGHHAEHHYPDHHKYHHHGLAAKAVLWPIAGLALLGAAAALVTNPILLQIGVATGKRRRRDTEESLEQYLDVYQYSSKESHSNEKLNQEDTKEELLETKLRQRAHLLQKRKNLTQRRITKKKLSSVGPKAITPFEYTKATSPSSDSDLFIPVPIKIKDAS